MTQGIIIAINAEQHILYILLLKSYNYVSDHITLLLLLLYCTTHINKFVVRAVHNIIT